MDCFVEEVRVEESVGTSLPKGCLGTQDFSCFFMLFMFIFWETWAHKIGAKTIWKKEFTILLAW